MNHRRIVKQLYDRGALQHLLGIPFSEKKHTIDLPTQNEALVAVERAWRNSSDMEESEVEQENHKANSDSEEQSLYSLRGSWKRRRIGSPGFIRNELNTVYVAESEADQNESGDDLNPDSNSERRYSQPLLSTSKSDVQARRAYWASKGLSGGPEDSGV